MIGLVDNGRQILKLSFKNDKGVFDIHLLSRRFRRRQIHRIVKFGKGGTPAPCQFIARFINPSQVLFEPAVSVRSTSAFGRCRLMEIAAFRQQLSAKLNASLAAKRTSPSKATFHNVEQETKSDFREQPFHSMNTAGDNYHASVHSVIPGQMSR